MTPWCPVDRRRGACPGVGIVAPGTAESACAHLRAGHLHGTRSRYVLDRCRCPACRRANTEAARRRSRLIAYGRWDGLVDAAPARQHVDTLRRQGLSVPRIAELSGVSVGAVNALVYGPPGRAAVSRLRALTSRRLLAVVFRAEQLPAGHRVDARYTQQLLGDLLAAGHTVGDLVVATGLSVSTLRRLPAARSVTAATERQLVEVSLRCPAARSLRYVAPADRTGPTGGTDIDEVAVERAVHGDRVALNTAERREAVRRLTASGVSGPKIALRLGVCGRTVTRARAAVRRYGEPVRP